MFFSEWEDTYMPIYICMYVSRAYGNVLYMPDRKDVEDICIQLKGDVLSVTLVNIWEHAQ